MTLFFVPLNKTNINQSILNPTLAASAGVAINSPEPTIVAVIISPGPRCLSMPTNVLGAGLGSIVS